MTIAQVECIWAILIVQFYQLRFLVALCTDLELASHGHNRLDIGVLDRRLGLRRNRVCLDGIMSAAI